MAHRVGVIVAGALFAVAAVGGCVSSSPGYGRATRGVFLESCNPTHDSERQPVCTCAYDQITQRFTYDDYVAIDQSLQDDPKALPADIQRLVDECEHPTTTTTSSDTASSDSGGSSSDSSSSFGPFGRSG